MLSQVALLGRYPAAIFPGDEPTRADIAAAVAALEAATPTPSPLRSPLLLGEWELIFASSGTVVTRTAAAQALVAASALPGVGVGDVRQSLVLPPGSGNGSSSRGSSSGGGGAEQQQQTLRTSNTANFGLGPFGEWEIVINGQWQAQDGQLARVRFDGFTLQLVGFLGALKLPGMAKVSSMVAWSGCMCTAVAADWPPHACALQLLLGRRWRSPARVPSPPALQISVPVPNGRAADFTTTYLSESLRVARSSTGNLFLFRRVGA